jgi:hypothetical protein
MYGIGNSAGEATERMEAQVELELIEDTNRNWQDLYYLIV